MKRSVIHNHVESIQSNNIALFHHSDPHNYKHTGKLHHSYNKINNNNKYNNTSMNITHTKRTVVTRSNGYTGSSMTLRSAAGSLAGPRSVLMEPTGVGGYSAWGSDDGVMGTKNSKLRKMPKSSEG